MDGIQYPRRQKRRRISQKPFNFLRVKIKIVNQGNSHEGMCHSLGCYLKEMNDYKDICHLKKNS